jgi:hypothetical protein
MIDDTTKKILENESEKTLKIRKKIQDKIKREEEGITPEALQKKIVEMHQWIAHRAHTRTPLLEKSISLFDENENSARLSKKISRIMNQIKTDHFEDPIAN